MVQDQCNKGLDGTYVVIFPKWLFKELEKEVKT